MKCTDHSETLYETVKALSASGKGILAADESPGSMSKKFNPINVENNEDNRRKYRSILFATEGLEQYISGTILHEETLYQQFDENKSMVDQIRSKGIVVGIKVDKGLKPLWPDQPENPEKFTNGLDSLNDLCKRSFERGARFAKWRCALAVSETTPSQLAIDEVARTLARYAKICQSNGLVPIVEPELLPLGSHSICTCAKLSRKIFSKCFQLLSEYKVDMRGCLLKPHMITPGLDLLSSWDNELIGKVTAKVLAETCPVNLGGVFFLSGGQDEYTATRNLLAINRSKKEMGTIPFTLSFSFGRALQNGAVNSWKGSEENREVAQKNLMEMARANWNAVNGKEYKYDLPKKETKVDKEAHDY
jgi:fructose-bisphosphate aldolase class I